MLEVKSDGSLDHDRFLHLHGQRMARLNKNQLIHSERQSTFLMTVISPFVLYGAEPHLKRLQEMTADYLVNENLWKEKLGRITDEWREFILYVSLYIKFSCYSIYLIYTLTSRRPYCLMPTLHF